LGAISYYDDRKCIVCNSQIPAERNTNSKTCSHECYLVNKKKVDAEYRQRKKEERAS
jgi:predicted nucleic acid-binding Zn ribbon protein